MARLFLEKYESTIEGQRQMIQRQRQEVLTGGEPDPRKRLVALRTIDDLLVGVSERRGRTLVPACIGRRGPGMIRCFNTEGRWMRCSAR